MRFAICRMFGPEYARLSVTDQQTPPDWVLIEAAKRVGWVDPREALSSSHFTSNRVVRALCDMIERYEARPVDRKLLCAERAIWEWPPTMDEISQEWIAIRAIELWEEGFGK